MAWTEEDPVECSRWLSRTLEAMLPAAIVEARAGLEPALGSDFKRTVSPSLALVVPAGWSDGDTTGWVATAAETLRGMPADLLERGCLKARQVADHPSKIIAAIFAEVGAAWNTRKREAARLAELAKLVENRPVAPAGDPMVKPEEAAAIIEEHGLRDASAPPAPRHSGPPRNPTTSELAEIAKAIGIDVTAPPVRDSAPIDGLSISEIFAQREARRAGGADFNRSASL